ncbi:nematocyst expressed protein 4 isoform X5 [Diabrotica virgifera virgifera]|uniref:Uncharacterized protein n=1 Tax=Diabrotica virgifera virgifera TaxID=50390 RepID=A0ABM5KV64_DIAVI|nr:nematocyst expressed protein 4 isoform X5 [Diabrotica virgifera virgifera]
MFGRYDFIAALFYFVLIAILVISVIVIAGLILKCTVWIVKRIRNGPSVTVTTTTQHAQSPQVVPPYPIDTRHPVPASNITGYGNQAPYQQYPFHQTVPQPYGLPPPAMGMAGTSFYTGHIRQLSYPGQFSTWSPACRPMSMTIPSAVPTPTHTTVPYFQTGNVASPMAGATPYPPQPYQQAAHDYSANPPPYDVAVSQPPLQPPPNSKEGYVKQSPYNPGYN